MAGQRLDTKATATQKQNRAKLGRLFRESPIADDELLVNLYLYLRSPVVAKLLYLNELYEEIVNVPGVIMEFGVWWGANMAAFESLRAVHDPYNFTRRVIGFDTFTGYPEPTDRDGIASVGEFGVGDSYLEHLEEILDYHQAENVTGHIRKVQLVPGDVAETLPRYLAEHPETVISLAYLDMQLYEPTKACLEAILPFLVTGSVLAIDELNSPDFPGETVAVREHLDLRDVEVRRSRFLPDRTIVKLR
jgi:hypothetical protein